MTKDEALKLGLQLVETAESLALDSAICGNYVKEERELIQRSKIAFEEALAQPEQEPVAWRTFDGEGNYDFREYEANESYRDEYIKRNGTKYASWVDPLYTSPPQRKPLTEREILDLLPDAQHGWTTAIYGKWVARAVERAHGIKGE